ncbi:MEMO1 family [Calycina marina]|uniref:MEMO1 family n=1 Tax=Calycina marina TaxID=1763456 RepID=A0A9P7Z3W0_9HELO|nr:MEMO1 family [Calycina marina]
MNDYTPEYRMTTRSASHAGSWYSSRPSKLSSELAEWLAEVPKSIDGKDLPVPGARVIIAPHAGYSYSGPAAAWAYASLDLSKAKRIFLLGPSHALYLPGCALSKHSKYATPLGDLVVDMETTKELKATGKFEEMSSNTDETEHSLEMHIPYIYMMLSRNFSSPSEYPPLVPILVGSTKEAAEKLYGEILAPYLADPTSVFIISSDFCHWGLRFDYTHYISEPGGEITSLAKRSRPPTQPTIHESIGILDKHAMDAIEGGQHKEFLNELKRTENTICGRHPIGVVMAAMEVIKRTSTEDVDPANGRFKFVRYERSSDCEDVEDSSVSYASAYAIL